MKLTVYGGSGHMAVQYRGTLTRMRYFVLISTGINFSGIPSLAIGLFIKIQIVKKCDILRFALSQFHPGICLYRTNAEVLRVFNTIEATLFLCYHLYHIHDQTIHTCPSNVFIYLSEIIFKTEYILSKMNLK